MHTIHVIIIQENIKEKDEGMACKKVYEQGRDDNKVKVNIQSPLPAMSVRQTMGSGIPSSNPEEIRHG